MKTIVIGLVTGFANGLFGSGGGTIIVPSMQKFLKVEAHKSHATAIAIILPLSILSMFIYLRGNQMDWMAVLYISSGGVVGGFVGAKMLNKIKKKWLHKIFGLFMVASAVTMLSGVLSK